MWVTWVCPWVGKIPWRRERLPTPVFGSGEFRGLYSHGVAKSWRQLSDLLSPVQSWVGSAGGREEPRGAKMAQLRSEPYRELGVYFPFYLFFPFIFIRWRLITLQYCSGFCHTMK